MYLIFPKLVKNKFIVAQLHLRTEKIYWIILPSLTLFQAAFITIVGVRLLGRSAQLAWPVAQIKSKIHLTCLMSPCRTKTFILKIPEANNILYFL
jgi:hypothetical protein